MKKCFPYVFFSFLFLRSFCIFCFDHDSISHEIEYYVYAAGLENKAEWIDACNTFVSLCEYGDDVALYLFLIQTHFPRPEELDEAGNPLFFYLISKVWFYGILKSFDNKSHGDALLLALKAYLGNDDIKEGERAMQQILYKERVLLSHTSQGRKILRSFDEGGAELVDPFVFFNLCQDGQVPAVHEAIQKIEMKSFLEKKVRFLGKVLAPDLGSVWKNGFKLAMEDGLDPVVAYLIGQEAYEFMDVAEMSNFLHSLPLEMRQRIYYLLIKRNPRILSLIYSRLGPFYLSYFLNGFDEYKEENEKLPSSSSVAHLCFDLFMIDDFYLLERLFKEGVDPDVCFHGKSLVSLSALDNNFKGFEWLIEHGAHMVTTHKNPPLIALLLKYCQHIEACKSTLAPLQWWQEIQMHLVFIYKILDQGDLRCLTREDHDDIEAEELNATLLDTFQKLKKSNKAIIQKGAAQFSCEGDEFIPIPEIVILQLDVMKKLIPIMLQLYPDHAHLSSFLVKFLHSCDKLAVRYPQLMVACQSMPVMPEQKDDLKAESSSSNLVVSCEQKNSLLSGDPCGRSESLHFGCDEELQLGDSFEIIRSRGGLCTIQ